MRMLRNFDFITYLLTKYIGFVGSRGIESWLELFFNDVVSGALRKTMTSVKEGAHRRNPHKPT